MMSMPILIVSVYIISIIIVTIYWLKLIIASKELTIFDIFVWLFLIIPAPISVLAMIPSDFVLWRKKNEK